MALVSGFGQEVFISGAFGIWQMTLSNLEGAKQTMNRLKLSDSIAQNLGINMSSAGENELQKPIFNAVTAYLLLVVSSKS